MKKFLIIAAAASFAVAGPAYAHQCPMLMQEVDAAMETAELGEAEQTQVMELRQSGEAAHEAGNHDQAVEDLNEALEILGET